MWLQRTTLLSVLHLLLSLLSQVQESDGSRMAPFPQVIELLPLSGPVKGGTRIEVFGQYFSAETSLLDARLVWKQEHIQVNVTVVNSTHLVFYTPSLSAIESASLPQQPYAQFQLLLNNSVPVHRRFDFLYYDMKSAIEVAPITVSSSRCTTVKLLGEFPKMRETPRVLIRNGQFTDSIYDAVHLEDASGISFEFRGQVLPSGVDSIQSQVYLALNGQDFENTNQTLNVTSVIPPLQVCLVVPDIGDDNVPAGPGFGMAVARGHAALNARTQLEIKLISNISNDDANTFDELARLVTSRGCEVVFETAGRFAHLNMSQLGGLSSVFIFGGESAPQEPNVGMCWSKTHQALYLAGMAAGSMTTSDTIGFVGDSDHPRIMRDLNAWAMGARRVNPRVQVIAYFSDDPASEDTQKYIAQLLLASGVDVVAHTTMQASSLHKLFIAHGRYTIGYDSDYASAFGDHVLTSVLRNWVPCFSEYTRQVMHGEFTAGQVLFHGIAEEYTDIAPLSWRIAHQHQVEILEMHHQFLAHYEMFCGPIYDNMGYVAVPAGKCLNDTEINSLEWMGWNAEGVENRGVVALTNCGYGKYSKFDDEFEFMGCETCAPGTFSGAEDTLYCHPCPEGSFSIAGICELCPRGTFAPTSGSFHCIPCPPGYSQFNEGGAECLPCKPGSFAPGNGSVDCTPCPITEYTPHYAAESCLHCPINSSSVRVGSVSIEECHCLEDHFSLASANGTLVFPNGTSSSTCEVCPEVLTTVTVTAHNHDRSSTQVCQDFVICAKLEQSRTSSIRLEHRIPESMANSYVVEQCPALIEYMEMPVSGMGNYISETQFHKFDVPLLHGTSFSRVYEHNLTHNHDTTGLFATILFINGKPIKPSSFFIELVEFTCPERTFVTLGPNGYDCEFIPYSEEERSNAYILGVILGFYLIIMLTLILLSSVCFRHHLRPVPNGERDASWMIKPENVVLNPEVLSQSTLGPVYMATYRSAIVVAKSMIPAEVEGMATPRPSTRRSTNSRSSKLDEEEISQAPSMVISIGQGKFGEIRVPSTSSADEMKLCMLKPEPSEPRRIRRVGMSNEEPIRRRDLGGIVHRDLSSDQISSKCSDEVRKRNTHSSKNELEMDADTPKVVRDMTNTQMTAGEISATTGISLKIPPPPSIENSRPSTAITRDRATKQKLSEQFETDMGKMVQMRHPNITIVLGAVVIKPKEALLVMEHMKHGSLHEVITNHTVVFDSKMIMELLQDIVAGMVYLHSASPPLLHCNLKAGSVLVDNHFRAKLTSFGFGMKHAMGIMGTPYWMAPELLRGEKPSTATDVYAFGILMFELLTRQAPYEGEEPVEVVRKVSADSLPEAFRPVIPEDSVPVELVDMMKECWSKNPLRRPSFEEISHRLLSMDIANWEEFFFKRTCSRRRSRFNSTKSDSSNQGNDKELVERVFPAHIAKALLTGAKVEPEQHSCLTIFFSDIVGFTEISRKLQPLQVMDMLDRLYLALDKLAEEHEVFKVETIGDAYMAVANLIHPQPDHVARICNFAFKAIAAANSTRVLQDECEEIPSGVEEFLHIRVGFHSGPAVASVVGSLNPRFCLFGDTVNTASRMESTSMKDEIHISEASASLLKEHLYLGMYLEKRGCVPIKGKGEMTTYWVRACTEDQACLRSLQI